MEKMGGIAKSMPSTFALFTIGAMASLALPGMSGFASEIAIFLGLTTTEVYSDEFKTIAIFLSAVGLMVTPVYLLSMLRQVFFGIQTKPAEEVWQDAKPRELAIAFALLIPIIGIGLYPKIATQTYDRTLVAVAEHVREALPSNIGEGNFSHLYARYNAEKSETALVSPTIPSKLASIVP